MEKTTRNTIPLVDNDIAHLVGLCYATFVFSVVFPPMPVIGPVHTGELNLWVKCNDLAIHPADLSLCSIVFLGPL